MKNYLKEKIEKIVNNRVNEEIRSYGLLPINEIEDNDVFIVGYPKSGHTWMQNLIASLLYCPNAYYLPDRIVQQIVPDIYTKKVYKRFGEISFFKSHEMPNAKYRNVIYLIRDGRDAMVSYYHMLKILNEKVTSIDYFIQNQLNFFPATWHEHVDAWRNNPYNANIIFVKYEDLLENTHDEILKICKEFNIIRSEEEIDSVIKTNSFQRLQEKEEFYGFDHLNWRGSEGKRFFRKGIKGGYKEEMSTKTKELFEKDAIELLKYYGYV